jgi:hypothetical protein
MGRTKSPLRAYSYIPGAAETLRPGPTDPVVKAKITPAPEMLKKIISSGETGAARGALDAAIRLDIPHGGWTIRGRAAEDILLPAEYRLEEIAGDRWIDAERQNIFDADGTLILSHGRMSRRIGTIRDMAESLTRPWLHSDLKVTGAFEVALTLNEWVIENGVSILNVAGSRASSDPKLQRATSDLLEAFYYLHLMKPETTEVTPESTPLPRRVEEAVSQLMRRMPLKDRTTMANMTEGELPALEPTLGEYIRNTFELDTGNTALLESCRWVSRNMKMPPDKGASIIIRKLWEELRRTHMLHIVK